MPCSPLALPRFPPTQIDVATWGPARGHQLEPVNAVDRSRFAAAFTLTAMGREIPDAPHDACTGNGWKLTCKDGTVAAQGHGCTRVLRRLSPRGRVDQLNESY